MIDAAGVARAVLTPLSWDESAFRDFDKLLPIAKR
jgi:hypothetical protein